MRRKISLYIDNQLADLDDDSFILFNYTQEDTSNPAIVRNSYSQQITLKGTPKNNAIFGSLYRPDRQTQFGSSASGVNFNPCRKTPFCIMNELDEVLESGYLKIDNISRTFGEIQYSVTLFGGLGSFFYGLSYDEDGNKLTLADLDYLDGGADELDFTIEKDSVREAWERIATNPSSVAQLWDVLNFAPAYNGIPSQDFDAKKAIVTASSAGLVETSGAYHTQSGKTLITMSNAHTEWETKDLRSYWQRPALSVKALMEAISNPDNNGGYDVEWDDFANTDYFKKTWITLPLLTSIQGERGRIEKDYALPAGTASTDTTLTTLVTAAPEDAEMNINVTLQPLIEQRGFYGYLSFVNHQQKLVSNAILVQCIGYNSSNNVVAVSDVQSFFTLNEAVEGIEPTTAEIIAAAGYTPVGGGNAGEAHNGMFLPIGTWSGGDVSFSLSGANIVKVGIRITPVCYRNDFGSGAVPAKVFFMDYQAVTSVSAAEGYSGGFHLDGYNKIKIFYIGESVLRSGATVRKKDLLSGDKTPADYLISFAKIFGLKFLYDKVTKKVTIMQRKNFFLNNTIDLTERVNLDKGITIQPVVFDKKWYLFNLPHKGEYADYYANKYNVDYGLMRANTGNNFNAESIQIMEGNAFNGAAEVLERSKFYNIITNNGLTIPSVFLEGGKQSLYNNAGEVLDIDIPPVGGNVTVDYINEDFRGYDAIAKAQFHEADNKSYDERDTLLLFEGIDDSGAYDSFALTDDSDLMMRMNNNVPCWILNAVKDFPDDSVGDVFPIFGRDVVENGIVTKSLEFAGVQEYNRPDVSGVNDSAFLYAARWKSYLTDQFGIDGCILRCHVDLSGLQVGEDLLRNFYWYDGALWVLNKITNHSITTLDPTECELIKVQDIHNYLQ